MLVPIPSEANFSLKMMDFVSKLMNSLLKTSEADPSGAFSVRPLHSDLARAGKPGVILYRFSNDLLSKLINNC